MTAPGGPASVPVRSSVALLAALFLVGSWGCTRQPERQWYKIGQPYTQVEFRWDKAECTRQKKLDFECMHVRGWVDVSPDRPGPSPAAPKESGARRY